MTAGVLAPVLIAAVAAWLFGAAYYMALGQRWMDAQDWDAAKQAEIKGSSGRMDPTPFVLSFIAEIVMAFVLAGGIAHMKLFGPLNGLIIGGLIWAGFVLTTVFVNNAYSMRRWSLSMIDSAHWLGVLLIQGAIIGWWMAG